jgi:hypothetical protein
MIKLERTSVMNLENAVRGMRNPMNSWDKCDSYYNEDGDYILGENDMKLAMRLRNAGSDHRKYLRQVFVSVDITAPLYWWKEYDTYKVGTTANSCSTMHKIHAKPFVEEDFSLERCAPELMVFRLIDMTMNVLNLMRDKYLETKDKKYWDSMIELLPSSYNQMRTCTLTYENLVNMYHARRNHKLAEWHGFCNWVEQLPYSELICFAAQLPKDALSRELFGDRVQEMQGVVKEQARGVSEDLEKIQPAMQNPLFAKMVAMEVDGKEGADGIETDCT